jgi:hypothetical protein
MKTCLMKALAFVFIVTISIMLYMDARADEITDAPLNTEVTKEVVKSALTEPEAIPDGSWSKLQISEEIAVTSLLFIDYKQSLNIQMHQGNYETNILIGRHPSNNKIKGYFIGMEALQFGVAQEFPIIRTKFLGGIIVVEGVVTARNKALGFSYKW